MGNILKTICCILPFCSKLTNTDCSSGETTWLELIVLLLLPFVLQQVFWVAPDALGRSFLNVIFIALITYAIVLLLQIIHCRKRSMKDKASRSIAPALPLIICWSILFLYVWKEELPGISLAAPWIDSYLGALIIGFVSYAIYRTDLQIGNCNNPDPEPEPQPNPEPQPPQP
jgi:hypothetical protein